MKKYKGFTLIELLVVIAIIGVLSALSVPAISNAKARALEADCRGNLRQIAIGLAMSADDNEGKYPLPAGSSGANSYFGSQSLLLSTLNFYIPTNSPVWFCKRYMKFARSSGEIVSMDEEIDNSKIGYFYWGWMVSGGSVAPMRSQSSVSMWDFQGWNSDHPGAVLLSDRFRNKLYWGQSEDWQYHGTKASPEVALGRVGSLVGLSDGSAHKIAPDP